MRNALGLLCLLAASGLNAAVVANPFEASVPVAGQSAAARSEAVKQALGEVIIKLTGHEKLLEDPEIIALLSEADRYLQQYRYESIQPVIGPDGEPGPSLALHANFDGVALERRLRGSGIALWGRERPRTLVWLAYSAEPERELLRADSGRFIPGLLDAAQRSGVPVVVPDNAAERSLITFTDIWGVFEEPLLKSMEDYSANAVLAGRIFQSAADRWAARWTLLRDDGGRESWESEAGSESGLVRVAIRNVAEIYANEFAVLAPLGEAGGTVMEIAGVSDLAAYARVRSYLESLSAIESVSVRSVKGQVLELDLKLTGPVRSLERSIALGRVLAPQTGMQETAVPLGEIAGISFEPERVLRYRYLR